MWSRWWPAPAKLNLFLHVTGRRQDGYHELQTLFQLLDAGDALRFRARTDGRIRRLHPLPGVPEDQDLVVRAARALAEVAGQVPGADIELRKRLPLGGGLGGGSSDAATVLVALDRLWGLGLGAERLARLGLALGADVPVFVRGRSAWGEGVGEHLQPVVLDEQWYLVVVPDCAVSTAEVFADPELTRNSPRLKIPDFLRGGETCSGAQIDLPKLLENTRNDCEFVVRKRFPAVASALEWLGRFGAARMSGTGAAVFAVFASEEQALAPVSQLPPAWHGFVARGVNSSGLAESAGSAD